MYQGLTESFKPIQFMIVDDDEISIMAIKRAFKKLQLANDVVIAKDGVEALSVLEANIAEDGTLPPYILTLDLNMPRMGGLEFLQNIRKNDAFKKLVVFVLTTSDAPSDIADAYDQNVAGYIIKESATQSFKEALEMLHDYANLVVLPS